MPHERPEIKTISGTTVLNKPAVIFMIAATATEGDETDDQAIERRLALLNHLMRIAERSGYTRGLDLIDSFFAGDTDRQHDEVAELASHISPQDLMSSFVMVSVQDGTRH